MKTLDDFLFELLGQWGLLEKKYEDLQGEGVVLDFSNTRGQQFRLRTITTDKIADFAFTREKLPYFRSFHFDAAGSPVFGVDRLVPGISLTNDFYADDNNGEYYFYTSGEFVRTYKIQYFFDELPTNGRAGYVYVDRRIDDVNPDFYYFTSDSDYSFVDLNEINYVHEEIDLPEIGEEDHFYVSSELSLFPQTKEEVLFASDGIVLPEDTTSVKYSDKYYLFIDGVRTEVFPEKSIRGEDFLSKVKEKNYKEVVYQQTIGESEEAYFSADLRETDENAYFEEQQLIRVDDLSELMGQQIGSKVFVSEENFYIDLKQEERIQIKEDDSFLTQGAPADINDIFVVKEDMVLTAFSWNSVSQSFVELSMRYFSGGLTEYNLPVIGDPNVLYISSPNSYWSDGIENSSLFIWGPATANDETHAFDFLPMNERVFVTDGEVSGTPAKNDDLVVFIAEGNRYYYKKQGSSFILFSLNEIVRVSELPLSGATEKLYIIGEGEEESFYFWRPKYSPIYVGVSGERLKRFREEEVVFGVLPESGDTSFLYLTEDTDFAYLWKERVEKYLHLINLNRYIEVETLAGIEGQETHLYHTTAGEEGYYRFDGEEFILFIEGNVVEVASFSELSEIGEFEKLYIVGSGESQEFYFWRYEPLIDFSNLTINRIKGIPSSGLADNIYIDQTGERQWFNNFGRLIEEDEIEVLDFPLNELDYVIESPFIKEIPKQYEAPASAEEKKYYEKETSGEYQLFLVKKALVRSLSSRSVSYPEFCHELYNGISSDRTKRFIPKYGSDYGQIALYDPEKTNIFSETEVFLTKKIEETQSMWAACVYLSGVRVYKTKNDLLEEFVKLGKIFLSNGQPCYLYDLNYEGPTYFDYEYYVADENKVYAFNGFDFVEKRPEDIYFVEFNVSLLKKKRGGVLFVNKRVQLGQVITSYEIYDPRQDKFFAVVFGDNNTLKISFFEKQWVDAIPDDPWMNYGELDRVVVLKQNQIRISGQIFLTISKGQSQTISPLDSYREKIIRKRSITYSLLDSAAGSKSVDIKRCEWIRIGWREIFERENIHWGDEVLHTCWQSEDHDPREYIERSNQSGGFIFEEGIPVAPGEEGKVYIDVVTEKFYQWSGASQSYVELVNVNFEVTIERHDWTNWDAPENRMFRHEPLGVGEVGYLYVNIYDKRYYRWNDVSHSFIEFVGDMLIVKKTSWIKFSDSDKVVFLQSALEAPVNGQEGYLYIDVSLSKYYYWNNLDKKYVEFIEGELIIETKPWTEIKDLETIVFSNGIPVEGGEVGRLYINTNAKKYYYWDDPTEEFVEFVSGTWIIIKEKPKKGGAQVLYVDNSIPEAPQYFFWDSSERPVEKMIEISIDFKAPVGLYIDPGYFSARRLSEIFSNFIGIVMSSGTTSSAILPFHILPQQEEIEHRIFNEKLTFSKFGNIRITRERFIYAQVEEANICDEIDGNNFFINPLMGMKNDPILVYKNNVSSQIFLSEMKNRTVYYKYESGSFTKFADEDIVLFDGDLSSLTGDVSKLYIYRPVYPGVDETLYIYSDTLDGQYFVSERVNLTAEGKVHFVDPEIIGLPSSGIEGHFYVKGGYRQRTLLGDNSVQGLHIKNQSLTEGSFAEGAIESLVFGSVESEKIMDDSVDSSKIMDESITAFAITDRNITNDKIQDAIFHLDGLYHHIDERLTSPADDSLGPFGASTFTITNEKIKDESFSLKNVDVDVFVDQKEDWQADLDYIGSSSDGLELLRNHLGNVVVAEIEGLMGGLARTISQDEGKNKYDWETAIKVEDGGKTYFFVLPYSKPAYQSAKILKINVTDQESELILLDNELGSSSISAKRKIGNKSKWGSCFYWESEKCIIALPVAQSEIVSDQSLLLFQIIENRTKEIKLSDSRWLNTGYCNPMVYAPNTLDEFLFAAATPALHSLSYSEENSFFYLKIDILNKTFSGINEVAGNGFVEILPFTCLSLANSPLPRSSYPSDMIWTKPLVLGATKEVFFLLADGSLPSTAPENPLDPPQLSPLLLYFNPSKNLERVFVCPDPRIKYKHPLSVGAGGFSGATAYNFGQTTVIYAAPGSGEESVGYPARNKNQFFKSAGDGWRLLDDLEERITMGDDAYFADKWESGVAPGPFEIFNPSNPDISVHYATSYNDEFCLVQQGNSRRLHVKTGSSSIWEFKDTIPSPFRFDVTMKIGAYVGFEPDSLILLIRPRSVGGETLLSFDKGDTFSPGAVRSDAYTDTITMAAKNHYSTHFATWGSFFQIRVDNEQTGAWSASTPMALIDTLYLKELIISPNGQYIAGFHANSCYFSDDYGYSWNPVPFPSISGATEIRFSAGEIGVLTGNGHNGSWRGSAAVSSNGVLVTPVSFFEGGVEKKELFVYYFPEAMTNNSFIKRCLPGTTALPNNFIPDRLFIEWGEGQLFVYCSENRRWFFYYINNPTAGWFGPFEFLEDPAFITEAYWWSIPLFSKAGNDWVAYKAQSYFDPSIDRFWNYGLKPRSVLEPLGASFEYEKVDRFLAESYGTNVFVYCSNKENRSVRKFSIDVSNENVSEVSFVEGPAGFSLLHNNEVKYPGDSSLVYNYFFAFAEYVESVDQFYPDSSGKQDAPRLFEWELKSNVTNALLPEDQLYFEEGREKWSGAILANDGCCYTIPFRAMSILKVNFQAQTTELLYLWDIWDEATDAKLYQDGASSNYSFDEFFSICAGGDRGIYFTEGYLSYDGDVVFVGGGDGNPTIFLAEMIFDVNTQKAKRLIFKNNLAQNENGINQSRGGVLDFSGRTWRISYAKTLVEGEEFAPKVRHKAIGEIDFQTEVLPEALHIERGWWGVFLAPNGLIFFIPYDSPWIVWADPQKPTGEKVEFLNLVDYFNDKDNVEAREAMGLTKKYKSGCLGLDGKYYCAPYDAAGFLVIDPETKEFDFFVPRIEGTADYLDVSSSAKYNSATLTTDGLICFAPAKLVHVLLLDTKKRTVKTFEITDGNIEEEIETDFFAGVCSDLRGNSFLVPHSFIFGDTPLIKQTIGTEGDEFLFMSPFVNKA